jgi:outer membrane receptor protein involved in Fe transport
LANGGVADGLSADMVTQSEIGYKLRTEKMIFNATVFLANVEEQNFEATTQRVFDRVYQSYGLELDGQVNMDMFSLRGGVTLTDAEIVEDAIDPTLEGKTPRRQAGVIYNVVPSFRYKKHAVGVSVIGTTKSYTSDSNQLIMPGYFFVNAFMNVNVAKNMFLTINGNNILNQIGITEAEEGSIVDNAPNGTIVRGRSITGRSISATLRFDF